MKLGDALELAFGLALAQRGAETGEGRGDEQDLGDGPESGKPEDPGGSLFRVAAEASENDGAGKGAGQSDDKGPGDIP